MKRWVLLSAAGAALVAVGVGAAIAESDWRRGDGRWHDDRGYQRYMDDDEDYREYGRRGWRERGEHRRGRRHRGPRDGAMALATFDVIDANGDGAISIEELDNARAQVFAAMDANGDGGVDAEELLAYRMRLRAEAAVIRLDENGDGALSIDEIRFRTPRLERFDLDENGEVTKTELRLALRGRRGWRGRGAPDENDAPLLEDETPAQEAPATSE